MGETLVSDGWFVTPSIAIDETTVTRYRARFGISELFEIELFLTHDSDLPMDADAVTEVLDSPCAFVLGERAIESTPVYGVLREWEMLECQAGYQTTYRAVMVPTAWYLTQTIRSRVFQDLNVPDILRLVLTEAGMNEGEHFQLSLNETYPVREYTVQYEESDFDFIARLLEHEGVFFYYDFADGTDVLQLGDHNGAFHEAIAETIHYAPNSLQTDLDKLAQLSRRHRVVPRRVALRDSNYRSPLVPLQRGSEVYEGGMGIVALYGEHFHDDDNGARIVRVRAEEIAAERELCHARGYLPSLVPGQTFELADHPLDELCTEFVVTAVERFRGDPVEDDGHRFTLLDKEVPYRPPRVTPKPRIYGTMHARIDGEQDGTAAPIDETGRYRVLLPFDGVGQVGGRASRWMRRAQVYAGPAYGMHFPLHIGTEVLITHIDGDPDRPVIAAAVPNPATESPVIDANATQSIVRTKGNIIEEYEDDA